MPLDVEAARRKADLLRGLHRGEGLLLLPNAWDCMSARVFEDCGFPAIATTSAGIAWALGCPDGERLGREETAEAVARVAGAVSVPVTADVEAGYGDSPPAFPRPASWRRWACGAPAWGRGPRGRSWG